MSGCQSKCGGRSQSVIATESKAGAKPQARPKPAGKPGEGLEPEFWRRKTLEEMSPEEWEALCDGCGKCCLLKLEDDETGKVWYTDVACRLFDNDSCQCGAYAMRRTLVSQCMVLTPEEVRDSADWMPRTCAYRLVALGYDLYSWHPLITGDRDSVHTSGISVQGQTTPEYEVDEDDLLDHVVGEIL